MGSTGGASEIVESKKDCDFIIDEVRGSDQLGFKLKGVEREGKSHAYPMDDDLCRILEAIDLRISSRVSSPSHQVGVQLQQKNTLKKPVQASGIGISESVTLKQALRKLCITQASEMAAVKRSSKSIVSSGAAEAAAARKLYASVVVQASNSDGPLNEERVVEVSFVPEKGGADSSAETIASSQIRMAEGSTKTPISSTIPVSTAGNIGNTRIKDIIAPTSTEDEDSSKVAAELITGVKNTTRASEAASKSCTRANKSVTSPRLVKPVVRNQVHPKKKGKQDPAAASKALSRSGGNKPGPVPNKTKTASQNRSGSPAPRTPKPEVSSECKDGEPMNPYATPISAKVGKPACGKLNDIPRLREKGECSQSSKSSMGDYSTSTSISEDSHSGSSGNGCRPHMSRDVRWVAIRQIMLQQGYLGLKNFKLLKKLGCGDIGTVYLAELDGSGCLFALKVMDIEFLVSRKKILRAQTEREILEMLDHPFLPTLYAHFTTDNLSCLAMEFCPGGDLHVLRQRQPGRHFSEPAARFYVAEVLLALEYLHMMGVIYRDLKPENILVREDGHIMLSDFDLSLRCNVSPSLVRFSSFGPQEVVKKVPGPCAESTCIDPFCLRPDWPPVTCFTPRLVSSAASNNRKSSKPDLGGHPKPLPQLVVEPTDARSNSFVGTHEYLAPEIIRGDGHGSSVDWWTLGIFLYELLYGRTPFKGPTHEDTLSNVVSNSLRFPENPAVSIEAKDLIRGLLVKDPENRLGSLRGAAEIKMHPFFDGLNWALVRCAAPPQVPGNCDPGAEVCMRKKKEGKCLDFKANGDDVEFELF